MKYEICVESQAKNVKKPMQTHEIRINRGAEFLIRPVQSKLQGIHCIWRQLLRFIEVGELKGTTAVYIIEYLKEQFSCHGIPDVLVTDNRSQLACREFTEFLRNGSSNT